MSSTQSTLRRRLGVHASIAGGVTLALQRANELGCGTVQIFSHNPRQWKVSPPLQAEVERFRMLKAAYDIAPVVVHTSYLINLATRDEALLERCIAMMINEFNLADQLEAEYLVLHTGSAVHASPESARRCAAEALAEIARCGPWKTGLLLENTAGERGDVTSRIADLGELINLCPGRLIAGICLDTCHAFAADYNLTDRKTIDALASEIEGTIGLDAVKVIHLNDSKKAMGSHVDRHEHLGQGALGLDGLRVFLRHKAFAGIPVILETPKKSDEDDPRNLAIARELIS